MFANFGIMALEQPINIYELIETCLKSWSSSNLFDALDGFNWKETFDNEQDFTTVINRIINFHDHNNFPSSTCVKL